MSNVRTNRGSSAEAGYRRTRQAVGWALVAVTPLNLLFLLIANFLIDGSPAQFTIPEIYYLSGSASFSIIGLVVIVEELGLSAEARQRRQVRRAEGKLCTVCGAVMRPGDTKCHICGSSPLVACGQCGALMSISAKRCPRCSYRME